MFQGMQAYAQQASYGAGMMSGPPPQMMPQMPPPPPPSAMGVMRGYGGYAGGPTAGAYGEVMAGRLANAGHMGMSMAGVGMAGLGMAGSLGLVGGPLGALGAMADPMGLAMRAGMGAFGMAGGGMGGLAAGGLAAGAVALPMYAGAQYAGALGRNFYGGMQDQMALNSNLRQNFNFMGGQGAFGRGFNQQQMGQIGSTVAQTARQNPFTSMGELNQLIAGGAEMGTFTGIRDVEGFRTRFREMITTLRTVQRELGGSLQEAQEFVNQSRQAGVFGSTQATRFAATIRQTSASTGMDQGQLLQLASNGAQIARSFGGRGQQGAQGALRGISQVSTMMQGGMINEGLLSEATGGRTGTDAMQAFVTDMMAQTGRFSRTAAGRYSIFGLSNREGTGLDAGAMMDFTTGSMSVGDLSRRAHTAVGGMGRARAINREGLLRGSLMEEGGIAGQLGMMRMMLGERAMDQGDDLGSLVLQRRFHMSRPQSEVMMSMMRNQGEIASREAADSVGSRREGALRSDITERRSVDAFMRNLEHHVQDATGMNAARDAGRSFVTRVSSLAERVMNDVLGISSDSMSTEGQTAMRHLRQSRATRQDFESMGFGRGGFSAPQAAFNIDQQGMFEVGPSVGSRLRARGMSTEGINTFSGASRALQIARAADAGVLTQGADIRALRGLRGDAEGTTSRILEAQLAAAGSGNADDVYRFMGGNGNATSAFMRQHGITNAATAPGEGQLLGRGGGRLTMGGIGRDLATLGGATMMGAAVGGPLGAAVGLAAGIGGMAFGIGGMRSEVMEALRQPGADATSFIARGGHVRERLDRLSTSAYFGGGQVHMTEAQRATQAAISGVSREDIESLQGNSDFMRRVRTAVGAGSDAERQSAMAHLRATIGGMDPASREGIAARSMLMQMQQSMATNGGALGSEFASFVQNDPSMRAAGAQFQQYQADLADIARRGGRGAGSRAVRAYSAALASGDTDTAMRAQSEMQSRFMAMSDSEFRQYSSRAMRSETGEIDEAGRAFFTGLSQMRSTERELSGQGRRRGRGAVDAAFGQVTGFGMGSMELSIGGRSVSGTRAQRMFEQALSGGGGMSRSRRLDIMGQFEHQLSDPEGLGFSTEQATQARDLLRGALSRRDSRGGFAAADRDAIRQFTGREDIQQAIQGAQQRQQAASLSQAEARDPIGRESLATLRTISTTLSERLPAPAGGGTPPTATPAA